MSVKFNRPVHFLLISVSLLVIGCAETPKAPITYNQSVVPAVAKNDALPRKLNGRFRTAESHKGTVWERLLSLYSLPEVNHPRVEQQLNWYLDHPAYIARIQQRAEPYLHLILDQIESHNIPGELALLPAVESAFIPDAYSKADASGLWQFIPDTGKLYGLEQNDWFDARRDILASTQAATSFLKHLGDTFNGDWNLALASYNWGKGNVWKAMERNENAGMASDYWSLSMPKETADYVPRLLAIAKLFANADEYGIHLNNIPNKPYIEVVDIDSPLDLQKAAQLAGMPFEKFMKLNPGFNRASTAPSGPQRLLLPVEKAESFKEKLALLPVEERIDQMQVAREEADRVRREQEREMRIAAAVERREAQERRRDEQVAATSAKSRLKNKSDNNKLAAMAAKKNITVAQLKKSNPKLAKLAMLDTKKDKREQWIAKAPKNAKVERVQVAIVSGKKGNQSGSEKSDKKASLAAQLAATKSQNYRKASVVLAKATVDTKSKKLKRI